MCEAGADKDKQEANVFDYVIPFLCEAGADKDDIDAVHFVKVDVLALGILTAIRKSFDLLKRWHDRHLALATVPAEDPWVYDMIGRADTMGTFQIESRAQMSMLPRLKPRCFYDLVIEVSIVRPGPIQGGMVHPYLEPLVDQLKTNMQGRGLAAEYAEQVAKQIIGFGEYGFPESHAASFALLIYVSCWLKHYYPAAFCVGLLNAQPMGFYSPRTLLGDARRHGVEARPVRVGVSRWDNTLEPDGRADPLQGGQDGVIARGVAIRLGLRQIAGFGEEAGMRVEAARARRPFQDIADVAVRARLDRGELMALARADAFADFGLNRRQACWAARSTWRARARARARLRARRRRRRSSSASRPT